MKKAGRDTSEIQNEMRTVSGNIRTLETELSEIEHRIRSFLEELPNIPADDVPPGGKENNEVVRAWGEKPERCEGAKDHVDLVTSLGLVDYERGVKMGGAGFWLYRGAGARLEWALLNYFVETHLSDGYEFVLPPHLLTYECGYTAGQFPKFADDVFHLKWESEKESRFLLPTSETALINFHRDEILPEAESAPEILFIYALLPQRGRQLSRPGTRHDSRAPVQQGRNLSVHASRRLRPGTGRTDRKGRRPGSGSGVAPPLFSKLAAQDASAAMAKTYDIEIWIPSMGEYKEVSSASNASDYQARRGRIRFKRAETGRNEFVHTLNASGLATSRLIPAIVEQSQRPDGSAIVPKVLRPYMGGQEILEPVA